MRLPRKLGIQLAVILALCAVCIFFYDNIKMHLNAEDISFGFGFLQKPAGFDVIMELIPFTPYSSNLQAFYVGILNTLLLSALSIVFSTLFAIFIAVTFFSRNWLLAQTGKGFINFFSNVPVLLQIFVWYFLLLSFMPQPSQGYTFLGFVVNVQGIFIGSLVIIPELTAMFLGLTLYATSHIATHIINAILAVEKGQIEAAMACRLSPWLLFRLILLPQALRLMIPPIVHQHLYTFKNTSLGAAVGYPDLVAIFAGTVLTQTGQALETIFMTMSFYLLISLFVAYLVDLYKIKTKIPGQ